MPRRILHVINTLNMGGAESLLFYTLTHLQNHPDFCFDVAVLFEWGPFAVALRRQGISVTRLGFRPRWNPWVVLRLTTFLWTNHYDLVHVHLFPAGLFVAVASMLSLDIPLVYTEHNVWNRRRDSTLWKALDGFMYGRYHRILAVSDKVGSVLTQWIPGAEQKVITMPNAVETSRFEGCADEDLGWLRDQLSIAPTSSVLLFVGRLTQAKGLDVLFDALSMLDEDSVLLVAGVGPLRSQLLTQAHQKHIKHRVRFLGLREDIPRLLKIADVFVLPSRWEGVPVAILEAMAAQKPIVTSAVGGCQEVVRHEKEALLVPVENAVALAEAIQSLLDQPDLASELASNARQRVVEHYSIQVVSDQLLNVYESVLSHPHRV